MMDRIHHMRVTAYRIPTDQPESDGTYEWEDTTIIVVQLTNDDTTGLGYTYSHQSTATLIHEKLRPLVLGSNAMAIPTTWHAMRHATRNIGHPGLAAAAVAAIDVAMWDLKARLLGISLLTLLGAARTAVPIYGSGGFTSYSESRLVEQLSGWVEQGIPRVKMKVGRDPILDRQRVAAVRQAIGNAPELFVDANGAYSAKQALAQAEQFVDQGVVWFEEPVSSANFPGLRLLRDRAPAGMEITTGEYAYEPSDFATLLDAEVVDVLMADATRCSGVTGFLTAAAQCLAKDVPLSCHTAPNLHAHLGCAAQAVRHVEYFHDHVRIESLLFDGALTPHHGSLVPDRTQPGMGLTLKRADAESYCIWDSNHDTHET
jgi:L-alanine-DL-glutamate epimerase-like enolase superfamily enzyme